MSVGLSRSWYTRPYLEDSLDQWLALSSLVSLFNAEGWHIKEPWLYPSAEAHQNRLESLLVTLSKGALGSYVYVALDEAKERYNPWHKYVVGHRAVLGKSVSSTADFFGISLSDVDERMYREVVSSLPMRLRSRQS